MRIKSRYFIFVSILTLMFLGCEVFFPQPEEIAKPENSGNEISLFNQEDTLVLWETVNLKINAEFNKNNFVDGTIYLDNTLVSNFDYLNNIQINLKLYSDGLYNFRIFLNSKSPVYSIGNKNYTYNLTDSIVVPVIISNHAPEPIKINSVDVENGILKLGWEDYSHKNFQEYQIYDRYQRKLRARILNHKQNWWCDSSYIGGSKRYYLKLIAKDQSFEGEEKEVNYPAPTIVNIQCINNSKVELEWGKHIFTNAFQKYKIYRNSVDLNYDDGWKNIKTLFDIEDTFFTDTTRIFGDKLYYRITVVGVDDSCVGNYNSTYYGNTIQSFSKLYYSNSEKLIHLQHSNTTYTYDANTMELVSTHNAIFPVFSMDCQSAYRQTDQTHIETLNPITFTSTNTYDLKSIIGSNIYQTSILGAANNNMILVASYIFNNPTIYYNKTHLIDLNGGQVLASCADWPNFPFYRKISPDGNYFILSDNFNVTYLYHYSGSGTLNPIPYSGDLQYLFSFYPDINGYITTNNNYVQTHSLPSGNIISQFYTGFEIFNPVVDEANELLAGENDGKYYIYDLNTGENVFLINVRDVSAHDSYYWYANNILFSKLGYYFKLEF